MFNKHAITVITFVICFSSLFIFLFSLVLPFCFLLALGFISNNYSTLLRIRNATLATLHVSSVSQRYLSSILLIFSYSAYIFSSQNYKLLTFLDVLHFNLLKLDQTLIRFYLHLFYILTFCVITSLPKFFINHEAFFIFALTVYISFIALLSVSYYYCYFIFSVCSTCHSFRTSIKLTSVFILPETGFIISLCMSID